MTYEHEVVISGISGRFPECNDVDSIKQILYNKENVITYDNRKWPQGYRYEFGEVSVPCGTGKYTSIQKYDISVFAVNSVLANQMDILNRMVMEPSFEAILDAGINPSTLMGANIGCYVGVGIGEVECIKLLNTIDKLGIVGCSKAMLANRISFALNLTGPSHSFYNGLLGGFEALSAAYQGVASGRIDAAIVGASSAIVDPKISLHFVQLGYLSPDALCRSFDAGASGYGRSEATILMFLQRAKDAKRNYGTVMLSKSILYGINPNTPLDFDEELVEKTFKDIYDEHKEVKPEKIQFFEMDASAVKRCEKMESNVVANVFCKNRKEPLLVGSVKSNVGHTESAAGFMSILKALFALDSDQIAPNMHFTKPNPELEPLVQGRLKVVTETTKLPGELVAVNSFSVNGELNHVVLKQNSKVNNPKETEKDSLPRLMILCGRDKTALEEVIKKVESKPLDKYFVAMVNDIFKTPLTTHIYRSYTVLPPAVGGSSVDITGGDKRPIWFVFSGMGSQWNGMGKGLLDIPIFAETVERCDKVLRPKGLDIYDILTSDDTTLFDDIVNAFVGIITIQVGLVNVVKALGIEADGIIGHSVGENACAYADGCLTLEQAVLASWARGVASTEVETTRGMMAAIGKGYSQIKDSLPEGIEVACHNSADSCTLTGPVDLVNKFVEKLKKEGIFARSVNVSNIAYHSKHIVPAAPMLQKRLKEVISEPKLRSSKWISTSIPESQWNEPLAQTCSAEYLTNNLVSSVLFEEGSKHIPENAVVIEIAPHGLLQAILKRSLHDSNTNVSLTLRSKEPKAVNYLLSAVGKLFIAGCQPDVNAIFPTLEYPAPRGTPSISPLATWDHSLVCTTISPMADKPLSQLFIPVKLSKGNEYSFIKAHRVKGYEVIPPSLYLYLTWHIFSLIRNEKFGNSSIVFENIRVHKHIRISVEKTRLLTVMVNQGSGSFEVLLEKNTEHDNPKLLLTGTIYVPFENLNIENATEKKENRTSIRISGDEFYKMLNEIGYELEDDFNNVEEVSMNDKGSTGKIKWNDNWVGFLDSLLKIYMYSDKKKSDLMFPDRIRRLAICTSQFESVKAGDELIFATDFTAKELICNGVEMRDFHYGKPNVSFLNAKSTLAELQAKKFYPHFYPQVQNISQYLNLCLQLIVENTIAIKSSEAKVQIVDTSVDATALLKRIINSNSWLKTRITFTDQKEFTSGKVAHDDTHLVIVNNFTSYDEIYANTKNKLDDMFVLTIGSLSNDYSTSSCQRFVEISKEAFENTLITLFKKIPATNGHIPTVLKADDNWVTKLSPLLKTKKTEPVILLRYGVELTDLQVMLSKQKKYPNIRCLFIMDDNAPQFSIDNPVYKKQIAQDLPVAVYKDGQWGSYLHLEIDLQPNENETATSFDIPISDYKLDAVDLRFIAPGTKLPTFPQTSEDKDPSYGFEFSGVSGSGKRKFGLGFYNPVESVKKPDEFLTWQIPKQWSYEDASTVPFFYLQVYYILYKFIRSDAKPVIILNSSNISFSAAFIAVASQKKFEIFVVVNDDNERDILQHAFPNMPRDHMLDRENCRYEFQLKIATKGRGVDLCVNCIADEKHLTAVLNCADLFGKYVEMTDQKYSVESEFGMLVFFKLLLFTTGPRSISSILELPEEDKKQLSILMENGIKEGFVKPLPRNVILDTKEVSNSQRSRISNAKTVYRCSTFNDEEEKVNKKIGGKLRCDDQHSFIIVSGGKKTKLWFELVEWLINRGARKFIVALDNFSVDPKISHQINRLLVQKKATIILTTIKKTNTVEDSASLIAEANNVAPLEAIFFVSLDPAGHIIENLDIASRSEPPFHFICMFSGGLKECERRRRIGFPAVLIHAEKSPNKLSDGMEEIERALIQYDFNHSTPVYELVDKSKTKGKAASLLHLSDFISVDMEKLEDIGFYSTRVPEFVEVPSLSLKYVETKGVYPIYVIPSTDAKHLQPLTSNLAYPVFCSTFSEDSGSAADIAAQLLKSLEKIQASGPVTIVGETWSSCIAIELSRLIQDKKRPVKLFLIEGDPSMWRRCIHQLGDINSLQFNNNLLKELINVSVKTNEQPQNWQRCLEQFEQTLPCPKDCRNNIIKTLNGIRNRLITSFTYEWRGQSLNHITLFKLRTSENTLAEVS
ncbi:hypothetical protein V9T40_006842 [Parthenolecanium corni]|uniref:Fatty acid synthase n=1 Tax=Parthenolecanium corni TaxID=536013 RepID=A0AAN9Y7H6_9HEMI